MSTLVLHSYTLKPLYASVVYTKDTMNTTNTTNNKVSEEIEEMMAEHFEGIYDEIEDMMNVVKDAGGFGRTGGVVA